MVHLLSYDHSHMHAVSSLRPNSPESLRHNGLQGLPERLVEAAASPRDLASQNECALLKRLTWSPLP